MEYCTLGLPSALMYILDVWAGASVRFCTGYLSVDIQSAQVIMMSIMVMLYMVGSGLDSASCAIIGQALGAGNVIGSKIFYTTFRIIASIAIVVVILLTYTFQEQIIDVYTDIPTIK